MTGEMPGPGPDPTHVIQVCTLFDNDGLFSSEFGYETTPVIVDGIAYFGSYNNSFYAIDVSTGREVWRFKTGDWIVGSAAVANGTVYFGSTDDRVYALDAATGDLRWSYLTDFGVSGDAVVDHDVVYIGSDDTYLYALKGATGELIWKHRTGCQLWNAPAIVDGRIYLAERTLKSLDTLDGSVVWEMELGTGFCFATPAVRHGTLYIGGYDGFMFAINLTTKTVLWKFATRPSDITRSGNARIDSSAAVTDDAVYFGATDGYTYALDRETGKRLWEYQFDENPYFLSDIVAPTIADDVLYMGSPSGVIFALGARSGEVLWQYQTDRYLRSSPVVLNGVVYLTARDGALYAFVSN